MKLIIQIPCYNEEESLSYTLADIPKKIEGITDIKVLVIDDGSLDSTVDVAINGGVDYIVRHGKNRGLANAFSTGIETALRLGADIIVNTDADNQYQGKCISDIVKPILQGKAQIVVGVRPIELIEDFTLLKKYLQRIGSYFVRKFASVDIEDTTSGFRAYSREAAMSIVVVSSFTYTLETIIQAGRRRIPLTSVPIKVNRKMRESRLFHGIGQYVFRSIRDILFISTQVRPFRTFGIIGLISFAFGTLIGIRFLVLLYLAKGVFEVGGSGHSQSLILAAILLLFGCTSFLVGLLADQIGANRILLERIHAQLNRNFDYMPDSSKDGMKIFYLKKLPATSVVSEKAKDIGT
jgi:glycosyltransferase involved in cell wall biosynthesis